MSEDREKVLRKGCWLLRRVCTSISTSWHGKLMPYSLYPLEHERADIAHHAHAEASDADVEAGNARARPCTAPDLDADFVHHLNVVVLGQVLRDPCGQLRLSSASMTILQACAAPGSGHDPYAHIKAILLDSLDRLNSAVEGGISPVAHYVHRNMMRQASHSIAEASYKTQRGRIEVPRSVCAQRDLPVFLSYPGSGAAHNPHFVGACVLSTTAGNIVLAFTSAALKASTIDRADLVIC